MGARWARPAGCSGIGMQFHWENDGYASFDDFLGALNSRKRKVLRRERRDANAAGLTFRALRGGEIGKRHWDAFYALLHAPPWTANGAAPTSPGSSSRCSANGSATRSC